MRHMTLDEWDNRVAPYLSTIQIRAGWIARDAMQIREWIEKLPAVPGFETEARERLDLVLKELSAAMKSVEAAINNYDEKEEVT